MPRLGRIIAVIQVIHLTHDVPSLRNFNAEAARGHSFFIGPDFDAFLSLRRLAKACV